MKVQIIQVKYPKHFFLSNLCNKNETSILILFFKIFSLSLFLVVIWTYYAFQFEKQYIFPSSISISHNYFPHLIYFNYCAIHLVGFLG